jgi:hypothetical protein
VRDDRPDLVDESDDVGMASSARPFDKPEVTGKGLEKEQSSEVIPGLSPALSDAASRIERAMAYRTRVEAAYRQYDIRPIKEARLAEVSDGHISLARSGSTPESHGVMGRDPVIPDIGDREFRETAAGAVDSDAVSHQAAVDAHQAEAAESAVWKTRDGDFCSWDDVGGRDHSSTEIAEWRAYQVHYRALAEAKSEDTHCSRDSGQPALRQPSAGLEGILLHADADPLRVFGAASETHPDEFREAMTRLGEAGVEVDLRPGSMSYSPAAVGGRPGRLILDPEASYGAVLHEMSHFSDDELAGFPGLRYWLEDPTVTADGESRAYQAEIDYANSIGETGIADQLEGLKAQRIGQLIGENDE